MNRNALAIAIGTGLTLFISSVWHAERRHLREEASRKPKKNGPAHHATQLHTWEGEGGNLPNVPPPIPATASGSKMTSH